MSVSAEILPSACIFSFHSAVFGTILGVSYMFVLPWFVYSVKCFGLCVCGETRMLFCWALFVCAASNIDVRWTSDMSGCLWQHAWQPLGRRKRRGGQYKERGEDQKGGQGRKIQTSHSTEGRGASSLKMQTTSPLAYRRWWQLQSNPGRHLNWTCLIYVFLFKRKRDPEKVELSASTLIT